MQTGFWQQINNLDNRSFGAKLIRFTRSKIMALSKAAYAIADEPRICTAFLRGWDRDHAQRLIRWRDIGFDPLTVYDIGANQGHWSQMCRHLFPSADIHLFEPLSQFHDGLHQLESKAHGGRGTTQLHPLALGNENGNTKIHLTENVAASSLLAPSSDGGSNRFGTQSTRTETIQVRRLDDLVAEEKMADPDLVKIDVQGFESEVFRGGTRTLNKARAIIVEVSLAELYQGQPLLMDMIQLLETSGFKLDDLVESCRSWPEGRLWQVDLWMTKKDEQAPL